MFYIGYASNWFVRAQQSKFMNDNRTKPEQMWVGEYGERWTQRNNMGVEEINSLYRNRFGISRLELLDRFFGELDRDIRILEVGANIGTQLLCFHKLGFENLYGIDIQREAIERAHQERPILDIIEGNVLNIPFKDEFFDLVFTSGVLIHIPEQELDRAMDEIVRCSSEYIFGHEYYSDEYTEIAHHGYDGVLWKTDYPSHYTKSRDLEEVDKIYLEHNDSTNLDVEFLLRRI
jgi:pseudaminic acid biosynthesis-associated methylase